MSGSNSNMSHVANVAKDLDGTDPSLSPYTWTCPDVDPYSTIYFYQFTPSVAAADEPESAWTTRFTVRWSARGCIPPLNRLYVDHISCWRNNRPSAQQAT